MKVSFTFARVLKFVVKSLLIFVLFSNIPFQSSTVIAMTTMEKETVFEELRLNVPLRYKSIWYQAERSIWEPWLAKQKGFLGRQIFYNEANEEALILVKWENKKLWKDISLDEVDQIQRKFEEVVKTTLKVENNPLKFIYEGELKKQL